MKIKGFCVTSTCLLGPLLITFSSSACAQSDLQRKIAMIAQEAQGTVSVSCLLPGTKLNCDLRARNHSPMQSMFKYPLALTVLYLAENGKLFPNSEGEPTEQLLNRKVLFLAADRIPNTFSPLQDRYPEGNVERVP